MLDRRQLVAGSLGVATLASTRAAAQPSALQWPPGESFKLWPGRPPGSPKTLPRDKFVLSGDGPRRELHLEGVAEPVVGVYRPANPDGRALLSIPGGGYGYVSVENEGINVARTFATLGVTVFVLGYRLPGQGWSNPEDVVLQDGQRAMRLIRANAARYGIDPARLGCVGFSAGGLLSASLAVAGNDPVYEKVDAADDNSGVPAFAGLIYPIVDGNVMRVGKYPSARFDASRRVRADTPPVFIAHALDDPVVQVSQPMSMLAACQAAKVPVEAHFFQEGGHGFGPRYLDPALPGARWPVLFDAWIKRQEKR